MKPLRATLEFELPQFFMGRVLPIDAAIADRWGGLVVQAGRPVPAIDSLLAATALVNGLQMVTRNHQDFDYSGLQTINPWQELIPPPKTHQFHYTIEG